MWRQAPARTSTCVPDTKEHLASVVESHTPRGQVLKEAQRRGPPDRHHSPAGRLDQQPAVCDVDPRPFRARPAGAGVLTRPAADMATDFLSRLQAVSAERRMNVPPACRVAVLVLQVAGIAERRIPLSDAHPMQCSPFYAEDHG